MIKDVLNALALRQDLNADVATDVFEALFTGTLSEAQSAALAMGLRAKGETIDEISAAVKVMRRHMIPATLAVNAIDVCGTGGSGHNTLNISTAVALVAAACGVPVAKHGNIAASSSSGSTDVLSALGVNIAAPTYVMERCVNEIGIGYFPAPNHHPAMRHMAGVRKELGMRTLFNLLGPMCNPASVKHQLIGVFDTQWLVPVATVLHSLGTVQSVIVHGHGGMDELNMAGDGMVYTNGQMDTITPVPHVPLEALRGGDPAYNAKHLYALLDGEKGPYRETVFMNANYALKLGGVKDDGQCMAKAVDRGDALRLLQRWIEMSNQS